MESAIMDKKQKTSNAEILKSLHCIIFNLNNDEIEASAHVAMKKFSLNFSYSFNLILCNLIYSSFVSQTNDPNVYFHFLKSIDKKEKEFGNVNPNVIDLFTRILLNKKTQEAFYLLEGMIQNKLIDPNIVKESNPLYFAHYLNEDEIKQIDSTTPLVKQFFSDLDKLKNDNWKYHKELIKQGINPKEIAQVIRDDNDEKLQILASQKRFDFNQRIQPSLYEKCTFINNNNVSLVDYAAFYGSLKCFKFLMLNGSRIMNSGKYSVVGGNLEIFHICEQNHSPFDGAYEAAIEFHRNDIFKYIFENKIQKIESLSKLGEKCIAMDNYELLWFLEENGMKIDDFIINESAKVGNILLVKYFIEGKQIPEDVLVSATLSENVELTKYLLEEEGVNSNSGNKNGLTPLMCASQIGNTEIVKLLLAQKDIIVNIVNNDGLTSLMFACRYGHVDIVKLLLEQEGININFQDYIWGKSALNYATEYNYIEIVKLLLSQNDINVNATNIDRWTPLLYSCEKGSIEIVKLLLEQKDIDVNAKNKGGMTALHLAARNGHVEIVELLLKHEGISINVVNNFGETALMLASQIGHIEIVKLLLKQKGIYLNARNINGKTAITIAQEKGKTEIAQLLLDYEKDYGQ